MILSDAKIRALAAAAHLRLLLVLDPAELSRLKGADPQTVDFPEWTPTSGHRLAISQDTVAKCLPLISEELKLQVKDDMADWIKTRLELQHTLTPNLLDELLRTTVRTLATSLLRFVLF
jgi:hypothetical protein